MRKNLLLFGALLGSITSLPVMALLYLGEQFAALPFAPFDLFEWLARVLPGPIVTAGIDTIVGLVRFLDLGPTDTSAKLAEQLLALGLGLAGGVGLGLVTAWLVKRSSSPAWRMGALTGSVAFVIIAAVELDLGLGPGPALALLWLALIMVGWGALLGRLLAPAGVPETTAPGVDAGRRRAFLKAAGGSALVTLGAWGAGRFLAGQKETSGAGQALTNLPTASPTEAPAAAEAAPSPTASPTPSGSATSQAAPTVGPSPTPRPTPTEMATMREQVEPAPGTRPELTPTEDFYRIDINVRPVVINKDAWELEVAGLFDDPRPLTLEDLMAYPPVTQPITLSCISNEIGGDLISTGQWTGVRLRDLLKDLGLRPEAQELFIEAEDDFYESVAMEDLMDPRTLLVYGMNGETLPVEHGFPLRIYIPNRYGMKQPKWITRIEAIDEMGPGYWVDRGWSEEARPHIISVIDTVAVEAAEAGLIPIGGIAWAGDRGIEKVEVQVDEGDWAEAVLRTPPLSQLTWVQWRYDWPAAPGQRTFTVRAVDGTGALQVGEEQDVRPNGATGYHSMTVEIPEV